MRNTRTTASSGVGPKTEVSAQPARPSQLEVPSQNLPQLEMLETASLDPSRTEMVHVSHLSLRRLDRIHLRVR